MIEALTLIQPTFDKYNDDYNVKNMLKEFDDLILKGERTFSRTSPQIMQEKDVQLSETNPFKETII